MLVDLTDAEVDSLLETLHFGQEAVRSAEGTPETVRRDKLDHLAEIAIKLRAARKRPVH